MQNVGVKPQGVTLTIGSAVVNPTGGTLTQSRNFIDFTAMDDTNQQQVPDIASKNGTFSVDFFINNSHISMLEKIGDSTATSCSMALTDTDSTASTASFTAYVSNINVSVGTGQGATGSCEVTLDSDITWS